MFACRLPGNHPSQGGGMAGPCGTVRTDGRTGLRWGHPVNQYCAVDPLIQYSNPDTMPSQIPPAPAPPPPPTHRHTVYKKRSKPPRPMLLDQFSRRGNHAPGSFRGARSGEVLTPPPPPSPPAPANPRGPGPMVPGIGPDVVSRVSDVTSALRPQGLCQGLFKRLLRAMSRAMSRAFQGLVKGFSRACQGLVKGLSRACQGLVKGLPRACQGLVKGLSRACQGLVKGLPRACQGVVKGLSRACQGAPWVSDCASCRGPGRTARARATPSHASGGSRRRRVRADA